MQNKSVNNIVFDLGGVLLQWDVALLLGESSPCHAYKAQLSSLLKSELWADFDRGKIDYDTVIAAGSSFGVPSEMMIKFNNHMCEHLTLNKNTFAIVRKLKGLGKNLYILSNMNRYVGGKLMQKYSFWSDFDEVIFSYDTGFAKPEMEIYQFLLKTINRSAADVLFIDDNEQNTVAAINLGIQSILFKSADQLALELFAK